MKYYLLVFAFLTATQFAFAAEEECPPASEVAEAQNHNLYKNCDYSEKGINGVLHRALVKTKESGDEKMPQNGKAMNSEPKENADQNIYEFNSPVRLQQVRFSLLQKLARECANGFVVESESYLPVPNTDRLKLMLIHRCL